MAVSPEVQAMLDAMKAEKAPMPDSLERTMLFNKIRSTWGVEVYDNIKDVGLTADEARDIVEGGIGSKSYYEATTRTKPESIWEPNTPKAEGLLEPQTPVTQRFSTPEHSGQRVSGPVRSTGSVRKPTTSVPTGKEVTGLVERTPGPLTRQEIIQRGIQGHGIQATTKVPSKVVQQAMDKFGIKTYDEWLKLGRPEQSRMRNSTPFRRDQIKQAARIREERTDRIAKQQNDAVIEKNRAAALARTEAGRTNYMEGGFDSKTTTMSLEEATAHMQSREASPDMFYNEKDWEAWAVMRDGGKSGEVRWNDRSDKYKTFSNQVDTYNTAVDNYFMKAVHDGQMTESEASKYRKLYKTSRGHLRAKGNFGTSHLRDADTNLSWENLDSNIDRKARMNFAEFVNSMGQGNESGIRIAQEEMAKIDQFIKQAEVGGMNSRGLKNLKQMRYGLSETMGNLDQLVDPSDFRYNDDYFTGQGNFRSYESMVDKGIVTSEADYEKARRLWLTMMEADPEFDLQGFLKNSPDTIGMQQLRHGLRMGEDVPWEQIIQGNKSVMPNFASRRRLLKLLKKAPFGILGVLGVSGATYAADSDEDAGYLEHVLANLEKYNDISIKPGEEAVMQGADAVGAGDALRAAQDWYTNNMATVPAGPTKSVADFMWGMGKEVVTEPVGLIASAIKTPVAPEENISFREQAQMNYNNQASQDHYNTQFALLDNRWTND